MPLKNNVGIAIIITLFISANLAFLNFYSDVWWDSSVYIGMGKYIYSSGSSGLWEESRPLVLPLILGLGWKLGLDAVQFGRAMAIIFSALAIFLVYLIGLRLFSKKEALLAAFFTAFSFTFLFFSPNMLTEMPSTFFILVAFYFFLEKRFFNVGFFAGIAVMTRLFQAFTLIGLGVVFVFYFWNKKGLIKNIFYIAAGASIFILPYFLLNYHLYNDVLLPFEVQSHLTKTTGWMMYREYGFYFTGLFRENFLIIFLLAIPLFFRRSYKLNALLMTPLIYILVFSLVKHKEMRFMLAIMPFLYLLLSYCLAQIHSRIKYKKTASAAFILITFLWIGMTFSAFKDMLNYGQQRNDEALQHFQDYMKTGKGSTWITSPLYALHSDRKIDGLLYFFSSENLVKFIAENENKADIVLYNSCDMECPPAELDGKCGKSRKALANMLSHLKKIYENEIGSCKYAIYRKFTY